MSATKILIVEDEQLVADDLRETLELLGYNISALVATGEDALKTVEVTQPDLVLMDIRLAGKMDGIQASELIQSRFQVPVVYLTANADQATLKRVKATAPFGYILKPFSERVLSTTIEIALSRYQAEQEVQKALLTAQSGQQKAETQFQSKSEYVSMVAHELRNPLTALKFAAEVLQIHHEQLPADKKQRYIDRIQTATNSLNDLLEDVLTLERATAAKIVCSPSPMDPVSFCQEVAEALHLGTGKHYELKFSAAGDRRIVYLDGKLLWHILNNILSNAIKYSPEGGTIFFSFFGDQEMLHFTVRDQGIGIPPEDKSTLFDPFCRSRNVGQIPGTGLGLAIAKQCVDLQGGHITVDSEVGRGSTFIVALPRHPRHQ